MGGRKVDSVNALSLGKKGKMDGKKQAGRW